MNIQTKIEADNVEPKKSDLPRYETPRIQVMSEKDILNSFQITQSMGGWWTTPTMC
jgi:hypothetical protein